MNKKSFTLNQIIAIANQSYPYNRIANCYDSRTHRATEGWNGDGLALFIVQELCETFDPKATKTNQLVEAERVIRYARSELENVRVAFVTKTAQLVEAERKGI